MSVLEKRTGCYETKTEAKVRVARAALEARVVRSTKEQIAKFDNPPPLPEELDDDFKWRVWDTQEDGPYPGPDPAPDYDSDSDFGVSDPSSAGYQQAFHAATDHKFSDFGS